jgi:hypothetical protein
MPLKILTTLLADKLNGQIPSAVLSADKAAGQQPMALFDIEEQTEHYLSLQSGGSSTRGAITGGLSCLGLLFLFLAVQGVNKGHIDSALIDISRKRPAAPPLLSRQAQRQ